MGVLGRYLEVHLSAATRAVSWRDRRVLDTVRGRAVGTCTWRYLGPRKYVPACLRAYPLKPLSSKRVLGDSSILRPGGTNERHSHTRTLTHSHTHTSQDLTAATQAKYLPSSTEHCEPLTYQSSPVQSSTVHTPSSSISALECSSGDRINVQVNWRILHRGRSGTGTGAGTSAGTGTSAVLCCAMLCYLCYAVPCFALPSVVHIHRWLPLNPVQPGPLPNIADQAYASSALLGLSRWNTVQTSTPLPSFFSSFSSSSSSPPPLDSTTRDGRGRDRGWCTTHARSVHSQRLAPSWFVSQGWQKGHWALPTGRTAGTWQILARCGGRLSWVLLGAARRSAGPAWGPSRLRDGDRGGRESSHAKVPGQLQGTRGSGSPVEAFVLEAQCDLCPGPALDGEPAPKSGTVQRDLRVNQAACVAIVLAPVRHRVLRRRLDTVLGWDVSRPPSSASSSSTLPLVMLHGCSLLPILFLLHPCPFCTLVVHRSGPSACATLKNDP